MGAPTGSQAKSSQRNRLEKREKTRVRRQGPARGQKTNDDDGDDDDDDDDDGDDDDDDDDDANIVLFCCYTDRNTKQQTRFTSLTMLTERSVITIAC